MDFLKDSKSPSSEPLLPVDACEKTASTTPSPGTRTRPATVSKMVYARRVALVCSVCLLVLLGVVSAGASRIHCRREAAGGHHAAADAADSSSFSAMLKSASPSSLSELLHRYLPDRFQDGVWPSEHQAIKAVHQVDAALATSVVQLARRADNSTTSASTTSSPTESPTTSDQPPTTSEDPSTSSTPTPSETSTIPTPTSTTARPTTTTTRPPPPGTSSTSTETTLSASSKTSTKSSSSSSPSSSRSSSFPPSSSTVGGTWAFMVSHTFVLPPPHDAR